MSEIMDIGAAMEEAMNNKFADVKVEGLSAQDDGSVSMKVTVKDPKESDTCKASDTEDADVKQADMSAREKAVGAFTDASAECDGADATDDDDETQDSGSKGPWVVNGTELDYQELVSMVSQADVPYPEDRSGDNLAEVLENAAADGATAADSENDTPEDDGGNDVSKKGDKFHQKGRKSRAYLVNNGVPADNVKTCNKHREKYGECHTEGCVYGAKSKSTGYCGGCTNQELNGQKGIKNAESSDNSGSSQAENDSTADRVKKVKDSFGVSPTMAREAVEAVNDGLAGSELAYIEAQE
jgi:hypothetical protein